jgi:hypothetical protein
VGRRDTILALGCGAHPGGVKLSISKPRNSSSPLGALISTPDCSFEGYLRHSQGAREPRVSHPAAGLLPSPLPQESLVEKTLKVGATLDYGSRPPLQLAIYPFKEWSSDLYMQALLQGSFVRSVPKLRVRF